mmetsp:Transcript_3127/g.4300  ORF Transcript_3127/g.4300 Transcript_3127/m.4300 type:complete len:518 (-) Transcript_3127:67-1620(-)
MVFSKGSKKKFWNQLDPLSETVPVPVETCACFLEEHGLEVEGIFRVTGYPNEIKSVKQLFSKHKTKVDLSKFRPESVASVLKHFFLEMADPLIPFEVYDCFLAAMGVQKISTTGENLHIVALRKALELLPPGNHVTLKRLMSLLQKCTKYSKQNKMNAQNLSTVFAPSLIRKREEMSLEALIQENKTLIKIIETFIIFYEELFVADKSIQQSMFLESQPEFVRTLKRSTQRLAASMIKEAMEQQAATSNSEDINEIADLIMEGKMDRVSQILEKKRASSIKEHEEALMKIVTPPGTLSKINFPNGDQYEGIVVNGKPNDRGKMIYADGSVYEGYFRDGMKHGRGILVDSKGNKYDGDFQNDVKHGLAVCTLTNGCIYVGEVNNGTANGHGVLYIETGGVYEGYFVDDKFHGHGTYIGNNTKYEGTFKHGKRDGVGTFLCEQGNMYTGQYVDGKMCGRGVYRFSNGDTYEGEFKNNLFDGEGCYYSANGAMISGVFREGKLVQAYNSTSLSRSNSTSK